MEEPSFKFNYNRKIRDKRGLHGGFWLFMAKIVTFFRFGRVKFFGSENVPKSGGFILASNHISGFDPITLCAHSGRDMQFMCKEDHFSKWYLPILLYFNGFPIRRGTSDRSSLDYSIRVVEEGHILCIFPEGTRKKDFSKPTKGKSGVALIARESHADVLPVSIRKLPDNDPSGYKVVVRYGELIKYEDLGFSDEIKSRELHNVTANIMKAIGDLWDIEL